MIQIIDRRLNGKNKSAVNRRRFIRRFKRQIREAAAAAVEGRSITDLESGERINIPARDISEPVFRQGAGGRRTVVQPGNREFVTGDRVPRPHGGGRGQGSEASNDGEGEDEFTFQLSREEFLEFFFEDLELPDLVKTELKTMTEFRSVRAGYTLNGVPSNINVVRSLRGALARRIALRSPLVRELEDVRKTLEDLRAGQGELGEPGEGVEPAADLDARVAPGFLARQLAELKARVEHLEQRIASVPFIDTFDLRYNNRVREPKPSTNAVMFCLMDVSGSMDEQRKDVAKRFFLLLYLFLTRTYEKIDVVFIRHHTSAKEVDEQDFFYARETGGTVVSSALRLMDEIVAERYSVNDWNIYAAQASDGDNWGDDSSVCRDLLLERIMPTVQYFAYVEIRAERHQSLWEEYEGVRERCPHFAMQEIQELSDIYPVFRELLKKREG